MHSTLALVPAVLLGVSAAAAQSVAAQDPSQGSSSSAWSQAESGSASSVWSSYGAGSATAVASGRANATVSNTASAPVSTSTQNPLIPSSISTKCQSFLTYLNSASSLSQCTTPLLSALSSFQPSPDSANSYTASSDQVHQALANLCTQPGCDDALVRQMLGGFAANCTAELEAKNEVVLGSYDALYVLEPLREAVCATDGAGAFCVEDIAAGKVPSTPSNTTSSASSSSNATTPASSVNITALASSAAAAASSTPQTGSQLAAQSYTIPVPAPQTLYVQITKVAKRWYGLAKRQYQGGSSGAGSSWSASSASVGAAPSSSTGSNSTFAPAKPLALALPSLLPNSQTWSTLSLPFLFLTPQMPSSTLCTPCTRTILASYIAFESRMPYALGLANSPLLGGQGSLWTGVGDKCGGGFLEGVAKQAGEASLTGAAAGRVRVGAKGVVAALAGALGLLVWAI
ncbi:hypothetical protein Rt10032_c17g5797 [Rhodotorula toruloides]|uniref:DUF7729 domain-containing protein n=1 Tax=Rhodotorula toruloides TaxID=5286 RepID=A0A511KN17_RHOTO|nr:hypothetical protein Rt10032_c17g5797 [Rhodotorula toruloides]